MFFVQDFQDYDFGLRIEIRFGILFLAQFYKYIFWGNLFIF